MPFQVLDVFDRPSRILLEHEKQEILKMYAHVYHTTMSHISVNDKASVLLNAQVGDIICMRNYKTDIYRLVC
jgi:DNA-directed RNA polymerase subunit H (RpoH/RPB5)